MQLTKKVWVQTQNQLALKTAIIAILLLCWLLPPVLLANQAELQEVQEEILAVRSDIQKSTASFLLIAKQLTQSDQSMQLTQQFVQITSQEVPVREVDLGSAPVLTEVFEGDELLLIEQRNDWLKVELEDGREGWVLHEKVQVIQKRVTSSNPISGDLRVRQMAEKLYENTQNQYGRAEQLFDDFEEVYKDLSSSEKAEASSIYSAYLNEKEKIQTYMAYADHYHGKFTTLPSSLATATSTGRNEIGFQGTASLRLGTASYESITKESTTSRNLNLNGAVIFSPQSRLNVNINSNRDVIQTPYTSNDVNLNFQHQTPGGTRLQGSVLFNSYNDENVDANSFQNVGVGARAEHPLNTETRIFGDIRANYKSYEILDGNEFEGAQFNTGVNYNGAKTQANVGVRGRLQNSNVSFLDYTRVIPNAAVRWLTDRGSFGIRAEAEQLIYDIGAEGNNFNRGRIDLQRTGRTNSTSLILIAKQFPNNEAFDNYRFRLQNQWNNHSGTRTGRTSMSLQYVYHPQENSQLTNFFDLRFDKNNSYEKAYFDVNLFGRYWEESGLDHRVNMFSRFGLKYQQFQIGPVVGAQLLLNPDDLGIERAGNTLRAGADARVNAVIQKATIYGSFRYQKSIIYSNAGASGIQQRMPTTIEANAGLQIPLLTALDLKIDATYFNVDLDISNMSNPTPNSTQSGLRFLAGVSYRFQRN